jgi:hypothetical protein
LLASSSPRLLTPRFVCHCLQARYRAAELEQKQKLLHQELGHFKARVSELEADAHNASERLVDLERLRAELGTAHDSLAAMEGVKTELTEALSAQRQR